MDQKTIVESVFKALQAVKKTSDIDLVRSCDILPASAEIKADEFLLSEPSPSPNKADVVIITALPEPEGKQLREAFRSKAKTWETDVADGVPFHTARMKFGKTSIRMAIASQSRMGMVDAALLAAKAMREWQPVYVVMTGICAGIRDKELNLGDVVIADEVFDYGSGKIVGKRLHPDYHFVCMHTTLCALLKDFATRTDVLQSIQNAWKNTSGKPLTVLKAHVGPMASGAAVMASQSMVKGIVEHKRKLLAVDMEAYGVAQATAHMLDGRTRFIVCKAVSDYADADETKGDTYQEYCSFVSALFIRKFFERNEKHLFGTG
jgi:nucleoside phosphorylase